MPAKKSARRPPRLLELFKGTGSVGRVFAANGFHVTSVDMVPRWRPTIRRNILYWNYRRHFRPGHFDVIWASPPCTEFSVAKTTGPPRNLRLANAIVRRTLQIIRYLRPRHWFLENPQTGLLKDQRQMRGLSFVDVDYCRFSDWGYRKPTRVWYGTFRDRARKKKRRAAIHPPDPLEDRRCLGPGKCPNTGPDGKHVRLLSGRGRPSASTYTKYRVPGRLVAYLTGLPRVPRDRPATAAPPPKA